jgi:cytochrome P450
LMDMDPPLHSRMRALVVPRLRAAAMDPLVQFAREAAHRLLDERAGTRIDIARDFAQRLPMFLMCRILGVPEGDHARIATLGVELVSAGSGGAAAATRMQVRSRLAEFFVACVREHGRAQTDDVLGDLARAVADDAVALIDVAGICLMLIVAGVEPTAALLTNIVHALATSTLSPEQVLDSDRRMRAAAMTEFLRYDTPVQWVSRITTRAVPMYSYVIPADQRVLLLIGAANRDPRRYEHPDRFDAQRESASNVSFGSGVHACPGMPLARALAGVGVEILVKRLGTIRLAGTAVRSASHVVRGFDCLPITAR